MRFLLPLLLALALACEPATLGEGEGDAGEGEGDAGEGEGDVDEGEGDVGEGEGEGDLGEGEGDGGDEGEEGEGEGDVGPGEGEGDVGPGEGEGEGEGALPLLRINEVSCRGTEFIEVQNTGVVDVDLGLVRFVDDFGNRPSQGVLGLGLLAPGGRAVVEPGSRIACDGDEVALVLGERVIDRVRPPLLPAGASWSRLDDEYARGLPTPGEVNLPWIDEGGRLFRTLDEAVPATLPQLVITLDPTAEQQLRSDGSQYVPAQLSFVDDAGSVGPLSVGMRIKGQSVLRSFDQKAAWRLDFDRFAAANHLFGIEALTLNNLVQDNSASHERLFYGLLARQGLPASRSGYVAVTVNGVFFGIYLALEASDDEGFLGRSFATTSYLYEGEYGQDLFVGNEGVFDQDFGGDDPTRATLATITADLDGAVGSALMADTADTISWPEVIPQMAADLFCGHWDSYTSTKNNFTLHIDDDGRLSLLSGGADQAFTEVHDVNDAEGRLMVRCQEDPACAAAVDDALVLMADDVEGWLAAGGHARLEADALALEALFAADPRREWDHRQIPFLVAELLDFVDARVAASRP